MSRAKLYHYSRNLAYALGMLNMVDAVTSLWRMAIWRLILLKSKAVQGERTNCERYILSEH